MIPAYWTSPGGAILWQIVLHSFVAGGIFYFWARRVELPSGRAKRWLLAAVVILPLATSLVPGRYGFDFREDGAWLDSSRLLALPLWDGFHAYHLVLGFLAATALVTLWQEVLPLARRPRPPAAGAPKELVRRVRELPGWEGCRVVVVGGEEILVATSGRPGRPRLCLSRGALGAFTGPELEAVLRHENAHWQRGRWGWTHLLFVLRLVQLFNPTALWAFREHSVEVEIDCDAEATAVGEGRTLARALLKVYDATDPRDLAARSTLRKRVDVLLGRAERRDEALPVTSIAVAIGALALLLPFLV